MTAEACAWVAGVEYKEARMDVDVAVKFGFSTARTH